MNEKMVKVTLRAPVKPDGSCGDQLTKLWRYPSSNLDTGKDDFGVWVPREPTKEMIDAGYKAWVDAWGPPEIATWKAMLAAAPKLSK